MSTISSQNPQVQFGKITIDPSVNTYYQEYYNFGGRNRPFEYDDFGYRDTYMGRDHVRQLQRKIDEPNWLFDALDKAGVDIKISMPSPYLRYRTVELKSDDFQYQVDVKKKRARTQTLLSFKVPVADGISGLIKNIKAEVTSLIDPEKSKLVFDLEQ